MSTPWWLEVVVCPRCGGRLEAAATPLVRCAACGPYPLLHGVPVLVADPSAWCSRWRDSILAVLAEHGAADRQTVAVVDAFARSSHDGQEVFADDWTKHEASGDDAPLPVKGPGASGVRALQRAARLEGPSAWLLARVPRGARQVVEVGCGAGELTERLAAKAKRVLVADRSLRAVLNARRRGAGVGDVEGVVLDAEAMPLRKRSVDVLVAENVIDLLDEPVEFLRGARAALTKGGACLLTTPEPSLGSDDEDAVRGVAAEANFKVREDVDGLPWLRVNSSRFVETYLVRALRLS